ncbi:MAG: hypothetical protein JST86_04535 [Bacteroidetes bacterium]|nr:hypothetical protein [Bacteroidota bacterium]
MKHIFIIAGTVVALALPNQHCAAQKSYSDDPYFSNKFVYEVGASAGFMNCFTDLGGGKGPGKKFIKDLNVGNTEPEGSIYWSMAYHNAVALRTEAVWGVVKASDAALKNVKDNSDGRYFRNLSFRSTIFEISLVSEIHPLYFRKYTLSDKLPKISPYLLGGIGYFQFNPRAKLNGQWQDLRPLNTEGEGFAEYPDRKIYKLKQINFPVGAGFKYKLSDEMNFSVECVYRILNTDYLDDVSTTYVDKTLFSKYFAGDELDKAQALYNRQGEIDPNYKPVAGDVRGNPKNNDAYFSVNFKIGITF